MNSRPLIAALALLICSLVPAFAQPASWVDTMDVFVREVYQPAGKYRWTWQRASLLRAMVVRYEAMSGDQKNLYLEYVREAMEATTRRAHGKRPNAVASAHGLAFLYRVTGDPAYLERALEVYRDFKSIRKLPGGGVSHKISTPELWDDTIFMIGVFLLEMYRATGDDVYIDDLMEQVRAHREALRDPSTGLWVHGWDGNGKNHCALCGQRNWPDPVTRRSSQIWGRGNGWVIVTLSDVVRTLPATHPAYQESAGYLMEMLEQLPELQDTVTGHWFQLPTRPGLEGNFIESSCTAMFAYGLLTAIQQGWVTRDSPVARSVDLARQGLELHSLVRHSERGPLPKNICKGTCIGDAGYYLQRKSVEGKPFGLAMFLIFGTAYQNEASMNTP